MYVFGTLKHTLIKICYLHKSTIRGAKILPYTERDFC